VIKIPTPKVKSLEVAKANIEAAAATVGQKYARGIQDGRSWKEGAGSEAAERLYNERMQEVLARQLRKKGVERANEEDWKQPALNKGAQLIGAAMRMSKEKWAKNFAPYADAIANTQIAERSSDPMANIDGRLKPIVAALVAKKKQIKG